MVDCIFCKISSGEIQTEKVFENEHVFAALDINPCAPGHTVVVPKTHISSVLEMTDEAISHLYTAVNDVTKQIQKALTPASFNIGTNDGPAAGQGIPHVHIHIIPRFVQDGGGSMHTIVRNPPKESVQSIASKIRKERIEIPTQTEKKEEKNEEVDLDNIRKYRRA